MLNGATSLHNGWAEALGQVLADERREWQLERELTAATHRAAIAELRAEVAALKDELRESVAARLAQLQDGPPGPQGGPGARGERGAVGESGERGERGPAGPPGHLLPITEWVDGVHYESAVVTHAGSCWCARRDTAAAPPHEDWILVAAAGAHGRDAPIGEVCGKYDPTRAYRMADLVAHDGGEWRAKRDDPGPLPGEGWMLSATQGKRGQKGERGEAGPPGPVGPRLINWRVDGYRAIPIMSDGKPGPALDLRGLFEAYHDESRR